ncbi:hypothetical protein [Pontibacter sp. BAB1700]|uniref:hypothetical protein n=1 Tax=Pontibacter sp. BAB1700 TaxID=1144253 RepID=UPI0002F089EF|nr:hypothetical protein [Pontibacter sp. BAB1700]
MLQHKALRIEVEVADARCGRDLALPGLPGYKASSRRKVSAGVTPTCCIKARQAIAPGRSPRLFRLAEISSRRYSPGLARN